MRILLERFSKQEMLQKSHGRVTHHAAEFIEALIAGASAPARAETGAVGVTKGLGVWVGTPQSGIAVSVFAANEARRILIESAGSRAPAQVTLGEGRLVYCVEFDLGDRGVDAKSVVVSPRAVEAAATVAERARHVDESVGAADETRSAALQGCSRGSNDVQGAMHGVGTVRTRTWTTHHFDRRRLGGVALEEFVDVAESRRS